MVRQRKPNIVFVFRFRSTLFPSGYAMCEQFMSMVFAVYQRNTFSFTHFQKRLMNENTSLSDESVTDFVRCRQNLDTPKKNVLIKIDFSVNTHTQKKMREKINRRSCNQNEHVACTTCARSEWKYQEHWTWLIYKWRLESIQFLCFGLKSQLWFVFILLAYQTSRFMIFKRRRFFCCSFEPLS